MYKGGSSYTTRSARVIRYAGLFVPIILISYGVLIQFGTLPSNHIIDNVGMVGLSLWWLFLSVLQFLVPSKTALDSALRLIAYHLLGGAYLVFVAGLNSPLVVCWLLLVIASNTYFSKKGVLLSVIAFALTVLADILLWHRVDVSIAIYGLVSLGAVVMTTVVMISISRTQEVARGALSRAKAQEALARDRILTIVNNLTDAVLSTDKEGIIRVYNASSLNLLDTNDDLNGRFIDDVLPVIDQEDKPVSLLKEFKALKGIVKRDDLNYTFNDDEEIRLEVTYAPIRSSYSRSKKAETHDGYIIIMRDITKSKSLEEERDEFISVISHELRTPLTIAEGSLSNTLVMMDHPDSTPQMLRDSVDMAHEQVIFLAHMVNDLSTLSRAERGVADLGEVIDIRELANKLHDEYSNEASAKSLRLNLDLGTTLGSVFASRLYLEELLQNFITNALKYTKTGTITITARQKANLVTFSIKDTGIGLSKSDQSKIFQKFFRSEDYRTRETGGTGLGLYVAAKLARKLNTEIKFTSRLNHGSTFSITLPVNPKQPQVDPSK